MVCVQGGLILNSKQVQRSLHLTSNASTKGQVKLGLSFLPNDRESRLLFQGILELCWRLQGHSEARGSKFKIRAVTPIQALAPVLLRCSVSAGLVNVLRGSGSLLSEFSVSHVVVPGCEGWLMQWQVSMTTSAATLRVALSPFRQAPAPAPALAHLLGSASPRKQGQCWSSPKMVRWTRFQAFCCSTLGGFLAEWPKPQR